MRRIEYPGRNKSGTYGKLFSSSHVLRLVAYRNWIIIICTVSGKKRNGRSGMRLDALVQTKDTRAEAAVGGEVETLGVVEAEAVSAQTDEDKPVITVQAMLRREGKAM